MLRGQISAASPSRAKHELKGGSNKAETLLLQNTKREINDSVCLAPTAQYPSKAWGSAPGIWSI